MHNLPSRQDAADSGRTGRLSRRPSPVGRPPAGHSDCPATQDLAAQDGNLDVFVVWFGAEADQPEDPP